MGKLIYSAITSLDGCIEDKNGSIEWTAPGEDVIAAINDIVRPYRTYLYGRRLYESMIYWETASTDGQPAAVRDFIAIWRAADKVVFSRTLQAPSTARTRIERDFDPAAIRRLKETSATDMSVDGATLGGAAIAAGLVDDCHLFVLPVIVGGGKRALPDDVRVQLELLDEHRLDGGVVHLHYRLRH